MPHRGLAAHGKWKLKLTLVSCPIFGRFKGDIDGDHACSLPHSLITSSANNQKPVQAIVGHPSTLFLQEIKTLPISLIAAYATTAEPGLV